MYSQQWSMRPAFLLLFQLQFLTKYLNLCWFTGWKDTFAFMFWSWDWAFNVKAICISFNVISYGILLIFKQFIEGLYAIEKRDLFMQYVLPIFCLDNLDFAWVCVIFLLEANLLDLYNYFSYIKITLSWHFWDPITWNALERTDFFIILHLLIQNSFYVPG